MKRFKWIIGGSLALLLLLPANAAAVTIGQIQTFEDGTTGGWIINLLGMGLPPSVPTNIPDGGPQGSGDNFLLLTSTGMPAAGGRLVAINVGPWTGDYLAAGINILTMDLNNFGNSELHLRLMFENPVAGPPTDVAISQQAIIVPANSGWVSAVFPVTSSALVALEGDVNTALANTTLLRIFHSETATFPGSPIAAQLGIDNIAAPIPEPQALALVGAGLLGLAARRFGRSGSKG